MWRTSFSKHPRITKRTRRSAARALVRYSRPAARIEYLDERRLLAAGLGLNASSSTAQPHTLADLPVAAQYSISAAIGRDQAEYHATANAAGFVLANQANGFSAQLQSGDLHVSSGADAWDVSLQDFGFGSGMEAVGAASVSASANRVDCNYGPIDEWYVNGPDGLQQGFTIAPPVPAEGVQSLTVELGLSGDLSAAVNAAGDGLTLTRPDRGAALSYSGLAAYDATGRVLPAWLEVRSDGGREFLLIHVNVAGAQGSITIDPFIQQGTLQDNLNNQSQPMTGNGGGYSAVEPATDGLSYSVAISGATAVVGGCVMGSPAGNGPGAALLFAEPGNGLPMSELTASDGQPGDQFGLSVAISGNTVVVGAPFATVDGNAQQGAAYVFVEPSSGWPAAMTETAKLTAFDGAAGDRFGLYLGISGDTVVVGAQLATVGANAQQGAAYVFVKPSSGWSGTMTQTAKLIASDGAAGDNLGDSVGISGNTVVLGAQYAKIDGNATEGAAYVFVEPSSGWSGTMTPTATLTASDGAANDQFGYGAVAFDNDTVLVGAPLVTIDGNAQEGAVYAFVEPFAGWSGTMTQTAKLTASNGAADQQYGFSVAISGTTEVIGALGSWQWYQQWGWGWVDVWIPGRGIGGGGGYFQEEWLDDAPAGGYWGMLGSAYVEEGGGQLSPPPETFLDTVDMPDIQTITTTGGTGPVTLTVGDVQGRSPACRSRGIQLTA